MIEILLAIFFFKKYESNLDSVGHNSAYIFKCFL